MKREITTCSSSWQRFIVRNPALKKLSVERNRNIGNAISCNFKPSEFISFIGESPPKFTFTEPNAIGCLTGARCCPWNTSSKAKPHRNLYSSHSNSTMLYPDIRLLLEIFSSEILEYPFPSWFTGTASSATACKITGQASSKQGSNFDETRGDWIPSRNGFHCKQQATKMSLARATGKFHVTLTSN